MERRKSKIITIFDEIIEEESALQQNLSKILNQVFSCVDKVKHSSEEMRQKDGSLILRYEMEILKKLTEINLDLESIIEENPLGQLKLQEKQYISCKNESESTETIKELESDIVEITSNLLKKNETSELSSSSDFSTEASLSSHVPEFNLESQNVERSGHFSDADIETLRNTLKKFSEKIGFNAESISTMQDYYQKSSSSRIKEYFDKPSISVDMYQFPSNVSNSIALGIADPCINSSYDIPEKDTNSFIQCELNLEKQCSAECLVNEPPIDNIKKNTESTPDATPLHSESNVEIDSDNCYPETDFNNSITFAEENCYTEPKILNDVLVEEYTFSEDLLTLDVNTNLDNSSEKDINQPKTDSVGVQYTALEKLNNGNFINRRSETLSHLEPVELPDIKLRPDPEPQTSSVIKNNFQENKKKKKNKKRLENEDVFFVLKSKPTPEVDTECAFSHVESPSEFYIHIVDDDSSQIDKLTEQLNKYLANTVSEYDTKEKAYNSIGEYCISFINEYRGYYRARILDWCLGIKCDEVTLQLVDYGNKRRVHYKNLRRMSEEMSTIPMLAIRCHLPLMYPPQSTSVNRLTEWPAETIDAMVDISALFYSDDEKNKFFKIVYAQEENGSLAVDLHALNNDDEHTVGQILLDLGFAVQIIEEYEEENMDLQVFLQDAETLGMADNINEAITGYDPRDEARICRFTKKDGTCFKGKSCKLEHVPLPKDGFTTDKMPVFKEAMYSLMLPTLGDVISIIITGYKDICNFFVQIIRNPHKEPTYIIDREFYTLLQEMNVPKTARMFETFKVDPAIGEIVIVKHWTKKWLRGVVRERTELESGESTEYQVYTVDFGDHLKVPISDLRKIKPDYLKLPFQAVECYIHNYKAKEDCDIQKKAKEFFTNNLYFHNFVAVTMSSWLPLKLEVKSLNRMDIGKKLAEMGFAENRLCDSNPEDTCPIDFC